MCSRFHFLKNNCLLHCKDMPFPLYFCKGRGWKFRDPDTHIVATKSSPQVAGGGSCCRRDRTGKMAAMRVGKSVFPLIAAIRVLLWLFQNLWSKACLRKIRKKDEETPDGKPMYHSAVGNSKRTCFLTALSPGQVTCVETTRESVWLSWDRGGVASSQRGNHQTWLENQECWAACLCETSHI